jgi:hypothetical protein
MRKLLPVLLIFSGCAMRAQQSFPGVNITPNGGAAGKINFRNSANVNKMFIQETTLDASASASATVTFKGSATAPASAFKFEGGGGDIVNFCDPVSGGAWQITRIKIVGRATATTCDGTINVDLNVDGTIQTSLGIGFYENGGLGGDAIGLRAPSGAVTSPYTINLPGTGPSVAGQALAWVSGSTYAWTSLMTNPLTTTGDIIYSSSGSTAARLGIGTAGQCLVVTAGIPAWGSCSSGASPFIDTTAILYSAATPANTWRVTLAGLSAARVATPPNSDFTMAGIDIAQTFSADQTLGANLLFQTDAFSGIGTAASRAKEAYFGGVVRSSSAASGTSFCQMSNGQFYCQTGGVQTFAAVRSTGQLTSAALAVATYRCLRADVNGDISVDSAACGTLTNPLTTTGDMIYSSSGTTAARLAIGSTNQLLKVSGGVPTWSSSVNVSALTLGSSTGALFATAGVVAPITTGFSTDCVVNNGATKACINLTNISATSPIVDTSGDFSCPTCVTTAGGQSISGTTTFSTASISTAIAGTFNMSGNGTVTGNWYERTFSGANASCGPVADGWLGIRTDTGGASGKPEIQVCIGGAMKYSALN